MGGDVSGFEEGPGLVSLLIGKLEIDGHRRVVRWSGRDIELGARAFDVLLALAERQERVVSKNELLDVAWHGLVVEENNLSVQISALRKALGAAAIRTVAGRGYRLAVQDEAALGAGRFRMPFEAPGCCSSRGACRRTPLHKRRCPTLCSSAAPQGQRPIRKSRLCRQRRGPPVRGRIRPS